MKTKLINFIIIMFGGIFGVHKFLEGKKGLGILYLLTLGVLGVGWIFDCYRAFFAFFSKKEAIPLIKKSEKKIFAIKLNHLIGLDFPEDTPCTIFYYEDKLSFKANNIEYSLPLDRIKDVSKVSSTEIQQQYVSSIGGAVTGAILFGGLGAIIGGRAKKKNVRKITKCLIITYLKDDEVKYISFDISSIDEFGVNDLIKKFKKEHIEIETTKIEL